MLERTQERPSFRTARVFQAPRSLVFAALTNPEQLTEWFAPDGFSMPSCDMDPRPGGVFRFVLRGPDGRDYPFNGMYIEVVDQRRLVYTGKIHDDVEVDTTLSLTDRGDGMTALTVEQIYSRESPATRGAPEGWKQTLSHLDAFLSMS